MILDFISVFFKSVSVFFFSSDQLLLFFFSVSDLFLLQIGLLWVSSSSPVADRSWTRSCRWSLSFVFFSSASGGRSGGGSVAAEAVVLWPVEGSGAGESVAPALLFGHR